MERKEQTGHICRWMALGIMTAIIIVGCTIVIGLFEWRDRNEIECRNAELHQWRKNVHDLNLHITELSLLGEMVADWASTPRWAACAMPYLICAKWPSNTISTCTNTQFFYHTIII